MSLPSPVVYSVVAVSGTTLFALAARYLGDATRWNEIAAANGLIDPWIGALQILKVPVTRGSGNGGILGL